MTQHRRTTAAKVRHTREWARQLMAETRRLREEAQSVVECARITFDGAPASNCLFALDPKDWVPADKPSSILASLSFVERNARRRTDAPDEEF